MDCIVDNILEVINCKDISIEELKGLADDELLEILFYVDEEQQDNEFDDEKIEEQETENLEEIEIQGVLTDFCFNGYYCILCGLKEKLIVVLINSNGVKSIIINSEKEVFDGTLERKLRDLNLYG